MRESRQAIRCAALAFAAVMLVSAPAEAEDATVYSFGPKPTWSVLLGPTAGGSFGSPGGGGYVGGEMSLARLNKGSWLGLYADGAYDFGHGLATATAGPSLGVGPFGLDGGVALRFADEPEVGGTARVMATIGFFALYGRWQYFGEPDEHVGQVGLLIKIPLWASAP